MKRHINAKEIVYDLLVGMNDPELMAKYKLSGGALDGVLGKLLAAGLIQQSDLDKRTHLYDKKVNLTVECPGCGKVRTLQDAQCPDCGADIAGGVSGGTRKSDRQTSGIQEPTQTGNRTEAFLRDVRAGLDDAGLTKKYNLSPEAIVSVLTKLMWKGLLRPEEFAQRKSLARTVYIPTFKCRRCGELHFQESERCPRCGGVLKKTSKRKRTP